MFSPGNLRATFDNPAYEKLISYYIGEKYTLRYTGGMVRWAAHPPACAAAPARLPRPTCPGRAQTRTQAPLPAPSQHGSGRSFDLAPLVCWPIAPPSFF